MKSSTKHFIATAVLAGALCLNAAAGPAGEVDLDKYVPKDADATLVEVNLKSNLIILASKLVEKEQPETAELLRSVHSVRVNVVKLNDENRADAEKRMGELRAHLEKKGWDKIVSVKEKGGEDVGIYVKARGTEAFEGVVVTVMGGGSNQEAVFINVVGDIKPDQIATVGKALDIEPLRKVGEALKKK